MRGEGSDRCRRVAGQEKQGREETEERSPFLRLEKKRNGSVFMSSQDACPHHLVLAGAGAGGDHSFPKNHHMQDAILGSHLAGGRTMVPRSKSPRSKTSIILLITQSGRHFAALDLAIKTYLEGEAKASPRRAVCTMQLNIPLPWPRELPVPPAPPQSRPNSALSSALGRSL